MTLDEICQMTTNPEILNAFHACRENHPLNNKFQWRNALAMACQNKDISMRAVSWLQKKAAEEANKNINIDEIQF